MKGNVNYLELANSPLMWVSAAIAVGIVVFQSVLFFRKSLKAAKEIGIEQEKINMAIKSSAISSIGPSIVILVTMISLIVSSDPLTMKQWQPDLAHRQWALHWRT